MLECIDEVWYVSLLHNIREIAILPCYTRIAANILPMGDYFSIHLKMAQLLHYSTQTKYPTSPRHPLEDKYSMVLQQEVSYAVVYCFRHLLYPPYAGITVGGRHLGPTHQSLHATYSPYDLPHRRLLQRSWGVECGVQFQVAHLIYGFSFHWMAHPHD